MMPKDRRAFWDWHKRQGFNDLETAEVYYLCRDAHWNAIFDFEDLLALCGTWEEVWARMELFTDTLGEWE